ncbi:MAG: hypothetical protein JNM07_08450 [Phycisphaerae bacterium]|nr:hypothetical protein [Phycisphaerae bacterium]
MHIVTKILVVFGAILAVLVAALTVAYSSNADAVRTGYKDIEAKVKAAESSLAAERASRSGEVGELQKDKDRLSTAVRDAESLVANLQNDKGRLEARVKQAEAEAQAISGKIDQLGATANTQAALLKVLSEEVTALRTLQLESNKREIQLVDRINDLDSQREVQEQNLRALQEQLAEARLALETAKQGGDTKTPGAVIAFEDSGPPIQARVQKTFTTPAGKEMAVISAGSARGIKKNMKMVISRNGQFVANLVVDTVDNQMSTATIDKLGRTVDVREDDMVLSRIGG